MVARKSSKFKDPIRTLYVIITDTKPNSNRLKQKRQCVLSMVMEVCNAKIWDVAARESGICNQPKLHRQTWSQKSPPPPTRNVLAHMIGNSRDKAYFT
jgi:hypothetical protein